jgi:hypothetical protein
MQRNVQPFETDGIGLNSATPMHGVPKAPHKRRNQNKILTEKKNKQ